jgi:hypothetical protein
VFAEARLSQALADARLSQALADARLSQALADARLSQALADARLSQALADARLFQIEKLLQMKDKLIDETTLELRLKYDREYFSFNRSSGINSSINLSFIWSNFSI